MKHKIILASFCFFSMTTNFAFGTCTQQQERLYQCHTNEYGNCVWGNWAASMPCGDPEAQPVKKFNCTVGVRDPHPGRGSIVIAKGAPAPFVIEEKAPKVLSSSKAVAKAREVCDELRSKAKAQIAAAKNPGEVAVANLELAKLDSCQLLCHPNVLTYPR